MQISKAQATYKQTFTSCSYETALMPIELIFVGDDVQQSQLANLSKWQQQ